MMKARLFFATTLLMVAPAVLVSAPPALLAQTQDAPPPAAAGEQGPPPNGPMGPMGQGMHGQMQGPGQGMGRGQDGHGQGGHGQEMHGHEGGPMGGRMMPAGMPPGTWWRNAELVAKVGLSPDQVKHIDDIFLQSRVKLIDQHASLEKEQLMLEPLLNANPVDQKRALAEIGKIADERAELEKTDAGMLLSIRGVLTAEQWTKLQADHGMRGKRGPGGPVDMEHGPRAKRGPGAAPAHADELMEG